MITRAKSTKRRERWVAPPPRLIVSVLRKWDSFRARESTAGTSVVNRIQILAAMKFGIAGPDEVAKLTKISASAADALILGTKPVTDKVLLAATRSSHVSAHWILTGEGSMSTKPTTAEGERKFLEALRAADDSGVIRMLLLLNLEGVLAGLPVEERLRCLSSIAQIVQVALADPQEATKFADGELLAHDANVSRALFQMGLDREELDGRRPMLTPLHEVLGAFGPEQERTLVSLLAD
jgi:hypothetical protein